MAERPCCLLVVLVELAGTSCFTSIVLFAYYAGATVSDMKYMLSVYQDSSPDIGVFRMAMQMADTSADEIIPSLIFTQILHRLGALLQDYSNDG